MRLMEEEGLYCCYIEQAADGKSHTVVITCESRCNLDQQYRPNIDQVLELPW